MFTGWGYLILTGTFTLDLLIFAIPFGLFGLTVILNFEITDKEADIQWWKDIYLYLLKKATIAVDGKRPVLKNQDNTTKIKLLLELFPDAKFKVI